MKKFLLSMLGVLLALPGIARDFTYEYEGQTLKYTVIDEEAKTCMTKAGMSDLLGGIPGNRVYGELEIPSIAKDGDTDYSVTKIGDNAFCDCKSLTSVIIPTSVRSIGADAFKWCDGLKKSAYPSGLNEPFSNGASIQYPREDAIIEDGFIYGPGKNAIFFAPLSLAGEYIIPESVISIGEKAFCYCSGLTSVTIPNPVTKIGNSAFSYCSGLTSVTIPNSVTSIGSGAFSDCSGLTSVTIPNSVTSIGSSAFSYCSGLTSVTIPDSVTSIGYNVFYECTGLKKSAYPSGLDNPFSKGASIQYPREGAIIEDGFVYGPERKAIYFAPLSLEGEYVIPESVTSIGSSAFSYCSGLTSVTIPNSVPSLDYRTFYECSSLKTFIVEDGEHIITFGESALDHAPIKHLYIGRNWSSTGGAFPTGLTSVEIGNSVTELPERAFSHYFGLTSVIIGNSVTSIGASAFSYCSGLTSVTIGDSVTSIGEKAFYYCSELTSIIIPNSVTSIGEEAFYYCSNLTSVIIGNSVTSIGRYAFYECTGLKKSAYPSGLRIPFSDGISIEYPRKRTIIEDGFVYGPEKKAIFFAPLSLAGEYIIPESVTSIGDNAFYNCTDLTSVFIPKSVNSIGDNAFNECTGLKKSAYPSGLNEPFSNGASIKYPREGAIIENGLVYGPEKNAILFAPLSLEGEYVIPNSVTTIGDYTFSYCSGLTSVTIPGAVTSIGDSAFMGCSGLTSVTIPGAVTKIGDSAFMGCSGLTSVTIPESVTKIGIDTFYHCSGLTSVTIPNSVTSIGSYAFCGCSGLTSVTIPNSVKSIGQEAFGGCSGLTSVTIPNSVKSIGGRTFYNCSGLTSVTIGNSVTSIGQSAFNGCTALTELVLPPSVKTIGASAFSHNNKMTSIIMGPNVTEIGTWAFNECPAQNVYITAQTPPTASDNTFSNYTGMLYVQGQKAADAYYDADYCWHQFQGQVMIEPTEMKVEGNQTLNGKPGDTFQLTATLYPENVTLPQVFWRSTNPDIATVDANGLVTLHADLDEIMTIADDDESCSRSCKIIAESLYANGPVSEFTVNNVASEIDDVINYSTPRGDIDFTAPMEVYNIQGVMVGDNIKTLAPGIYIVRQGNIVKKIAVKTRGL